MAAVEVGSPTGPVDGQVGLADLGHGLGGVLQPGRDLHVAGVGADNRLDVTVEHRQPLGIPAEGEPLVRVATRPPLGFGRSWSQARFDAVERALIARGRSLSDASLEEMEAEWQEAKKS